MTARQDITPSTQILGDNGKSPHLDPIWLRQKYEVEGLSTYDIGKIVGRDPKRIHEKIKDFGIPTRPRGLNLKGDDNYLRQSGGVSPWIGRRHTDETKAILSIKHSVPKPYLRGTNNGMAGRIGPANPRYRGGTSPERQRIYSSGEWRALIRLVYQRDCYKCRRCGSPKVKRRGLHAHHIKGWAEYPDLRFDATNLVTLCKDCHEWVHSRKNAGREWIG